MITIDLENRSMIDGKTILIDRGVPKNGYVISDDIITYEQLEDLYHQYKYSVPNPIKYKKNYFKALNSDNLSIENMIAGANRTDAKFKLEHAILTGVLNGSLKWPDESKWFWQSEKDKDFIILRKWIIPI